MTKQHALVGTEKWIRFGQRLVKGQVLAVRQVDYGCLRLHIGGLDGVSLWSTHRHELEAYDSPHKAWLAERAAAQRDVASLARDLKKAQELMKALDKQAHQEGWMKPTAADAPALRRRRSVRFTAAKPPGRPTP